MNQECGCRNYGWSEMLVKGIVKVDLETLNESGSVGVGSMDGVRC